MNSGENDIPIWNHLLRKLELDRASETKHEEIRAYYRGHDRGCLETVVTIEVAIVLIVIFCVL